MKGLFKRDKEKIKNDIDKYKYLKILSFEDNLKQLKKSIKKGAKTSFVKFLRYLVLFIFLSFLVSLCIIKKPVIGIVGLVLTLLIFYFYIQWLNRWLLVNMLGRLKRFSFIIIFTIIYIESLIVSFLCWLIVFLSNGYWMYSNLKLNYSIFIFSIIFTFFQTKAALKYHPSYLVELLYAPIVTVLAIISLLPYFWEPQIRVPKSMLGLFISWAIVLSAVTMTLIQILLDRKCLKNEAIAQEIFQEQLLKNEEDIDYNRLVECYYYGGEKYKEKLLNTEKFLRLIEKRESI